MKVTGVFGSFVLIASLLAAWLIVGTTYQPAQTTTTQGLESPKSIPPTVSQAPVFRSCVPNESYRAGEVLVLNNQWNRRLMGPNDKYEQCIQVNNSKDPLRVEWTWSWPILQRQVKAYPEIIYGWAPWLDSSTDPHLPLQLSLLDQVVRFQVNFDTEVIAESDAIYNTAFDLFITRSSTPTPENRTHEVMIWINDQHPWISTQSESHTDRILIAGEHYDFWSTQGIHPILIFRKVLPISKGSLVINDFLDYLMNRGYLPAEGYLADIEFGNEIVYGSGHTYINDYSVTPLSTTIFNDVPYTHWAWEWIERSYNAGLMEECVTTPMKFCPADAVTRADMAVFLLRGIHGASYSPPAVGAETGFSDVPVDHWAAAWIKQLQAEGLTDGGCGVEMYCPDSAITRGQMAVFLVKTKHGSNFTPPAASGLFNDVPIDHRAAPWIEQLVREGITNGCGEGIYCPDRSVRRAQMAVFLVRTFNLPRRVP